MYYNIELAIKAPDFPTPHLNKQAAAREKNGSQVCCESNRFFSLF